MTASCVSALGPVLLSLLFLGGCTSLGPGWTASADLSTTEGSSALAEVPFSGFQRMGMKPGEDFQQYSTLAVLPATLQFKLSPTDNVVGLSANNDYPMEPNFQLSAGQQKDFLRYLHVALRDQLQRSVAFEWVDTARSDSLLVAPSIVDLVMLTPMGVLPGSEFNVLRAPAVMTIVIELKSAKTGEVLARIVERRVATANGSTGTNLSYVSSPVENVAALRNTFDRWAFVLKTRLDATKVLGEERRSRDESARPRDSSPS